MFNFFSRPEYKVREPVPYITPPAPNSKNIYSIGATDDTTRMTLTLGYSTLTMTKSGCQNLIDQLEVFKNQLSEE